MPGINQVQANPKAGLTFARALRSILRSDPDIVLLGEIRDHETAQIAIEAALTGHLVLSTLHTNDAPSAVTRLIEMGIEPFLVGSALDCVLAQRLARRLCPKCKEAYTPTARRWPPRAGPGRTTSCPTLFRAVGCSACSKTGYKGRLALHEVMPVDEEIERLAVSRASADAIGGAARAAGHDDAARRRPGQGAAGAHLDRGDPARRRLTSRVAAAVGYEPPWPAPASRAGLQGWSGPSAARPHRPPFRHARSGAPASRWIRSAG